MTLGKRLVLVLGLAAAGCGSGCGSGDSSTPDAAPALDAAAADAELGPDAAPRLLSDIEVTVEYEGNLAGDLVVGAFHANPPMGPPLAFQSVTSPTFPVTTTLRDLDPGTYYVIAVLDLPPASPTAPGPEDIQAASDPMEVDGAEDLELMMTITEPAE